MSRHGKARKLEAAATVQQAERLRRQHAEALRAQHWVHWLTPLLVASVTLTAPTSDPWRFVFAILPRLDGPRSLVRQSRW
jgi:hypothetical protein